MICSRDMRRELLSATHHRFARVARRERSPNEIRFKTNPAACQRQHSGLNEECMRGLAVLLFALAMFPSRAAEKTARASLFCLSFRFEKANARSGGLSSSLEIGSEQHATPLNGELAPTFDDRQPTHSAFMVLTPDESSDPIEGLIGFDIPPGDDANGNTISDVFEVDGAASGTTQGLFTTPIDQGTVRATWNRAAGSTTGTCRLQLTGSQFGTLPDFVHTFEILEYKGSLRYERTSTNAFSGVIHLTQTGHETNALAGKLAFTRHETNKLNEVLFAAGALTNAAAQTISFAEGALDRDAAVTTNYSGFFQVNDGDLETAEADYAIWVLVVEDQNDSDHNGVPDFSDEVATAPVRLSLGKSGASLALTIQGSAGKSYELQTTVALAPPDWQKAATIVLTNDQQTVTLTPTAQTQFWRAKSQ